MIRPLKHDELSLTRGPAQAFFAESGIDGVLDFEHFCASWGKLIELDIACVMLYFGGNNEAQGIIGGTVTPCTMTGQPIAQEAFWWVSPHLRGKSPAGLNLLRKWEWWAKGKSAVRAYVGNLYRLNDQAMRQLYSRLGYDPLEIHYVKQL
jgi:hypothetical protein